MIKIKFYFFKEVIVLANAINNLALQTSKVRTALWCALQISSVNYKQSLVALHQDQNLLNETQSENKMKTKDFLKKSFQLETDLSLDDSVFSER